MLAYRITYRSSLDFNPVAAQTKRARKIFARGERAWASLQRRRVLWCAPSRIFQLDPRRENLDEMRVYHTGMLMNSSTCHTSASAHEDRRSYLLLVSFRQNLWALVHLSMLRFLICFAPLLWSLVRETPFVRGATGPEIKVAADERVGAGPDALAVAFAISVTSLEFPQAST